MPRTLSQGEARAVQRARLQALQQQQTTSQQAQPSQQIPTVTLTSREQDIIRRGHINLSTIDRRNLLKQLTLYGISMDRAREIEAANQPALKVYGAKSPGGLVQQGGYTYTTAQGQQYSGTRAFLETKQPQQLQAPPQQQVQTKQPSAIIGTGKGIFVQEGVYLDLAGDRIVLEGQGKQLIVPGSTKASPPSGGEITAIDTTGMIRAQPGVYLDLVNQKVESYYEEPNEYELQVASEREARNIRIANEPKDFLGRSLYASLEFQKGMKDTTISIGKGIYGASKSIGKTYLYMGIKSDPIAKGLFAENMEYYKPTYEEVKTTALVTGVVAASFIPVVNIGVGAYYTYKLGKGTIETAYAGYKAPDLSTKYQLYGKGLMTGSLTAAIGIPTIKEIYSTGKGVFYLDKVKQYKPTIAEQKAVEPFSRQRATVILKTQKGGYVLGKTKGGDIISFGGVANKGETLRKAAYRELFEETGLKGVGLKSAGKVVTPEETFHLYTATLTKSQLKSLTPSSDIASIVTVPAWRVSMMKGITGQTAFQPVSRLSLYPFGKIRSYETGIINYLETGQQPTWLTINTKMGKFVLGTQSRYDVPWVKAKAYNSVSVKQLYAHGTPSPKALQGLLGKKKFIVEAGSHKRGEVSGLYIQPPVSPPIYPSVIKLKGYTGTGKILKPEQVRKLPVSVQQKASEGYVGLSYMGYGTTQEVSGVRFGYGTPTAYLFKESAKNPSIVTTPKALLGKESERVISVGTVIETAGKAEPAFLGWRTAYFQPSRIVRAGEKVTGKVLPRIEELGQQYVYVNPSVPASLISIHPSLSPSQSLGVSGVYSLKSVVSLPSPLPSKKPSVSSIVKISEINRPSYSRSYVSPPSIIFSVVYPSKIISSVITRPSKSVVSYTSPIIVTALNKPEKYKSSKSLLGKYTVEVRRFGQFKPIGTYGSLKSAFSVGRGKVVRTLAATFRIKGAKGIGTPRGFYSRTTPKGRLFIQQPRFRLATGTEKREIQMFGRAKRRKRR